MFRNYTIITLLFFSLSCSTQSSQVDLLPPLTEKEPVEEKKEPNNVENSEAIQLFMDGLMFMEQGDYSRAIIEFQDAIELGSSSGEIYYSISECYWMIQKYDKSISYGLLAIDHDKDSKDYSISLGKKYIGLNELTLALDLFERVAEKYEDNADVILPSSPGTNDSLQEIARNKFGAFRHNHNFQLQFLLKILEHLKFYFLEYIF